MKYNLSRFVSCDLDSMGVFTCLYLSTNFAEINLC